MEENTIVSSTPKRGFLENISFGILFAVAFLSPIFFIPVTFISNQFGTSLLFAFGAILATLVMVLYVFGNSSVTAPKSNKFLVGAFLVVPIVYILAGIANGFSRMVFLGYTFDISTVGFVVLSFLFLFMISILFMNKKRIFYSYVAFVVSAILVALFVISRMIFGVKFLSFGIFTDLTSTTLGSWNNVGIFFGIGVILSLVTNQMLRVSKLLKVVLTLAILVSLFFLILVNFSILWIIAAACSFLLVLYGIFGGEKMSVPKTWREKFSTVPLYPSVVFIISVIFIVWGNSFGGYLANKFKVTNLDVRPSFTTTMNIAKSTIVSHPIFGSGPNTFINQWLAYKPAEITGTDFWNTDFVYGIGLLPTFAVTTGVVGILSWLVFFGLYLYYGFKSLFTRTEDSFVKYLSVSSFFVSLYLWVMACVYVPSVVIFILTFFFTGLFFASTYLSGVLSVENKSFGGTPRSGFGYSFVLVLVFLSVISLGYGLFTNSKSLWYFQKSAYAINTSGDITLSESQMKSAASTVPYDLYYRSLAQIELLKLKAILSQDAKTVNKDVVQKQFSDTLSDAITAGLNAKNADSLNYLNWLSLGQVYQSVVPLKVTGAYESAKTAYNEALRNNPKNPGIVLLMARLEMDNGNLDQAKQLALAAIQAKQNYLDAYYLLAQIEVANKNIKGAIDSVTAATVLSPNDPALFFQLGVLKYNNQDYGGAIGDLEHSITLSPDYANAKYFLGLSYEVTKQHDKAIKQFEDLKVTNPDSAEVNSILTDLKAGKSIFKTAETTKTDNKQTLPIKENQ